MQRRDFLPQVIRVAPGKGGISLPYPANSNAQRASHTRQMEQALRNIREPLLACTPAAPTEVFSNLLERTVNTEARNLLRHAAPFTSNHPQSIYVSVLNQHKNILAELRNAARNNSFLGNPKKNYITELERKASSYTFAALIHHFAQQLVASSGRLAPRREILEKFLSQAKSDLQREESELKTFLEEALCWQTKEIRGQKPKERNEPITISDAVIDLVNAYQDSAPPISTVMEATTFVNHLMNAIKAKLPGPLRSIG